MKIRTARLLPWHIPALAGRPAFANTARHVVEWDLGRFHGAPATAAAAISVLAPGYRVMAAWGDGSLLGFAVTRRPRPRLQARVEALAMLDPAGGNGSRAGAPGDQHEAVCAELLRALSADAAARGCVSVSARAREDGSFHGAFTSSGFAAAAREYVFRRPPTPVLDAPAVPGLRRQARADLWDLQQLYRAVTPAAVQQVEAPIPQPVRPPAQAPLWPLGRAAARESYVVPGEHGLAAWLEVERLAGPAHRLSLMAHPRSTDLVAALIRFGLWRLGRWSARPVQTVAREHEGQLAATLEAAGFAMTGRRVLMVRHVAARIAAKVPRAALDRVTS
jgi:hypothetical protein